MVRILFALCWPLAILALILFSIVWLLSLPLRPGGISVGAVFALIAPCCSLTGAMLGFRKHGART